MSKTSCDGRKKSAQINAASQNNNWTSDLYDDKASAQTAEVQETTDRSAELGAKPLKGLEPTRYGDWEKSGRCIDF